MIEPVLMISMGLVIAVIVVALYMPIFRNGIEAQMTSFRSRRLGEILSSQGARHPGADQRGHCQKRQPRQTHRGNSCRGRTGHRRGTRAGSCRATGHAVPQPGRLPDQSQILPKRCRSNSCSATSSCPVEDGDDELLVSGHDRSEQHPGHRRA